jgi:hypothetical protein
MPASRGWRGGRARAARPASHPVTIILGAAAAVAGQPIPPGFPGLSFERGALNPGNARVPGYLFSPGNAALITLFRSACRVHALSVAA